MKYQTIVKRIRNELDKYIDANNIQSLVIGISGGIDSAVCAALARPICDKRKIPLIGRSLPIQTNKQDEINRAEEIGLIFCTDFKEKDLSDEFTKKAVEIELSEDYKTSEINYKIRMGNIKARMRMIELYNLASAWKGMVLSTDNYTEYQLGFSTIMGDWGDFGMIQECWKTEVYEIAKYLKTELDNDGANALQKCIIANPTDGLGISNSDLDQINAKSYEEVDSKLKKWINIIK